MGHTDAHVNVWKWGGAYSVCLAEHGPAFGMVTTAWLAEGPQAGLRDTTLHQSCLNSCQTLMRNITSTAFSPESKQKTTALSSLVSSKWS